MSATLAAPSRRWPFPRPGVLLGASLLLLFIVCALLPGLLARMIRTISIIWRC